MNRQSPKPVPHPRRPQRRHRARRSAALAATGALLTTSATGMSAMADEHDEPIEAGIVVERVEDLPEDFINGVDISSVLSLEDSEVVFRDTDGQEVDLFEVLAEHDVNYVRIRVWNDPFDDVGRGYGGGNVDVDRAIQIGQRATDAGMRVLVNFHYSDFWADPGKQMPPKEWEEFDGDVEQTAEAVRDFTADALQRFDDAGIDVGMVQVGNETNNAVAGVGGLADLAQVLGAGAQASRDVMPEALIAVHFTNPETQGRYAEAAAALDAAGVDYDVFASSYYAFWHGSLENLTEVLSEVAATYDKQVMVAETSWNYTLDDGDGHQNTINPDSGFTQYPASVQGQADAVRDVIEAVVDAGGIGVFYWEPAWLPVGPPEELEDNRTLWERDGSGWATSFASDYDPEDAGQYYGGTSWDNQALFDFDGHPLESLNVFSYVRTGATAPREATHVWPITVIVGVDEQVQLPPTVVVHFNDRSTEDQDVTWGDTDVIDGPGTYTITGITSSGLEVVATVIVQSENYVLNGSFEEEDLSMWVLEGEGASITNSENAYDGERALDFWAESDYSFSLTQELEGLPPGEYVLSATTQGGDATGADLSLSTSTGLGEREVPLELAGWQEWRTAVVEGIEVADDGLLTLHAAFSIPGGGWGTFDDVRLVRVSGDETPAPTLTLSADQVRAGGQVDVSASGFALEEIEIGIESEYQVLANVPLTDGAATATVTIPAAVPPGPHSIQARDADGQILAEAPLQVLPAPTDPTTDPSDPATEPGADPTGPGGDATDPGSGSQLPDTGTQVPAPALLALLVAAAGTLVLTTRRRARYR